MQTDLKLILKFQLSELSVTFLSFPPGNRGGHGEGAENTEDIMCGSALSVPSSRPLRLNN